MSGALNPSNGVNRFHASTTTASSTFGTPECGPTAAAAAAAAAASFLELTNTAAAAAAVAAAASASAGDFGYDFGLGGFRAPPPPAHTSAAAAANFGVSYFTSDAAAAAAAAAENYASLAWEAQSAALAAAAASPYHQGQPAPHFTSCDFGPFSIPGPGCPGGRIPGMAVQRFGSQVRGSACGTNGGSAGHNGGGQSQGATTKSKPRRRVATIAQRRAANIRERRRMFNLNSAFDKLRKKVPTFAYEKRLSRIETLRLAIMYIAFMTEVIRGKDQDRHPNHDSHIGLPSAPYTAGHALTDGHLWTPSHGTSPLTDGAVPRSERLSHLCSRQV